MAYEQREGQGSLFKNEKQNDRQPDFKGTIMIKGVLYNVSAWNRTSQNGRDYISLQAEEKQASGSYQQRPQYQQAPTQQYQAPVYQAPPPTIQDIPAEAPDMDDLPF